MKKTLLTLPFIAISLLASCGDDNQSLVGTWKTLQTSDSTHAYEGFTLGTNGIASSVKDPLNQYNHWKAKDGKIVLSGKRFSDTSVVAFTDTLKIERLSSDTIVVSNGDMVKTYFKE